MKKVLPKNDFYIQATMAGFAALLADSFPPDPSVAYDMRVEAVKILQELIAFQNQLLGPEHPETMNNTRNLSVVTFKLKLARDSKWTSMTNQPRFKTLTLSSTP